MLEKGVEGLTNPAFDSQSAQSENGSSVGSSSSVKIISTSNPNTQKASYMNASYQAEGENIEMTNNNREKDVNFNFMDQNCESTNPRANLTRSMSLPVYNYSEETEDDYNHAKMSEAKKSPATTTKSTGKKQDFVVQKPKRFQISYESMVWFVFIVITILCLVDRFVMKGDTVLKRKGRLQIPL